MDGITFRFAGEALDSFIGYLTGYVVEVSLVGPSAGSDPLVVMVDCAGRTDQGFTGLQVRQYDEEQMGVVGRPFVIDFETVTAITVF
jgi:hypothetical protein